MNNFVIYDKSIIRSPNARRFKFKKCKNQFRLKNFLQNFLSESLVEDVPWECSKALIILKQGYQVQFEDNAKVLLSLQNSVPANVLLGQGQPNLTFF